MTTNLDQRNLALQEFHRSDHDQLAPTAQPELGRKSLLEARYHHWSILLPEQDLDLYYETFVLGQYNSLKIRRGDYVLDAGASIGDFSLLASEAVGSRGLVVSLEPDPYYCSILQRNLRANGVQNCAEYCVALADKTGTGVVDANKFKSDRKIVAATTTINDVMTNVGISHFDVIKLDIEGAEEMVFRNTSWLHNVREVVVETHGGTSSHIRKILDASGYQIDSYDPTKLIHNLSSFMLRHPLDLIRTEGLSRGLAIRRILSYLHNPARPLLLIAGSDSPIQVVHAMRHS